jgi:hypothetical protein
MKIHLNLGLTHRQLYKGKNSSFTILKKGSIMGVDMFIERVLFVLGRTLFDLKWRGSF